MRKTLSLALTVLIVLSLVAVLPVSVSAAESSAQLMTIEWYGNGRTSLRVIPPEDDSITNMHYELLDFHWKTTINYYINPSNRYGFSTSNVVVTIEASADAWDRETASEVFSYKGTTRKTAGKRDGYNVVSWGSYKVGAIAVTYIWYNGDQILETDCRMNTYYKWSLSGQARRMDVQNIMTHEFGHWCGLADLYADADYWLTMYGYAGYGETYKRTLGLGDINGLEAFYGP